MTLYHPEVGAALVILAAVARSLGVVMVFVTILAAVAFADGIPVSLPWASAPTTTTLAMAVVLLLLVPQMAIERTMDGYDCLRPP